MKSKVGSGHKACVCDICTRHLYNTHAYGECKWGTDALAQNECKLPTPGDRAATHSSAWRRRANVNAEQKWNARRQNKKWSWCTRKMYDGADKWNKMCAVIRLLVTQWYFTGIPFEKKIISYGNDSNWFVLAQHIEFLEFKLQINTLIGRGSTTAIAF